MVHSYLSLLHTKDPVINKFRRRIFAKDNDVFLILAGKRGSTKSGDAIRLGYEMDVDHKKRTRFFLPDNLLPPNFKMLPGERMPRVFYKPSQFLNMIKTPSKFPMASCFVWDEVGVEGDARDFAKKKNKLLKRVFQTIRSLNWFIMLTAVTLKDFDIAFGRSAGFYMKVLKQCELNINGKLMPYGKTKVYETDINPTTAKAYHINLRYQDTDGQYKVLSNFYYIKKPPDFMEKPYKRYKKLFQTTLYREYSTEMDEIDDFYLDQDTEDEMGIIDVVMKDVLSNPQNFYDYKKKKFVLAAIQYNGQQRIKSDILARKVLQLLNFKLSKGEITLKKP